MIKNKYIFIHACLKEKPYGIRSLLGRWINCFAFLLILFFPSLSFSQDCGCTDCPRNIFANGNQVSICYEMANALNDNLADPAQGICGVELIFTHDRVQNLEIALTSPDGQTVQLIGPHQPFGLNGVAQTFQVGFVAPHEVAIPDPGHNAVWDNEDFTTTGGVFMGTYYPFQGSLSDFNSGVVNGSWCLQLINHDLPSGFNGEIIDFNITLCDPTGQDCCFADAGNLLAPDTTLCEGDEYLDYSSLQPNYDFVAPDDAEYEYAYVISENGIIQEYNPSPDLRGFPAGNYEICGISFRRSDAINFPEPNGSLTAQQLQDDLNGANPSFCGHITDDCIRVRIAAPNAPTQLSEDICKGDSLFIGGTPFFIPGSYTVTVPGFAGCDSTITLDLGLIAKDTFVLDTSICELNAVIVGDSIYTQTGSYTNVLSNVHDCDSLVFLNLTVFEHEETILSETICEGECYQLGDSCYTQTGLYSTMLTTEAGCDSLLLLNLLVLEVNAVIAEPDSLGCEGSTVLLDGRFSDINSSTNIQWYFEDIPLSGDTNSTVTASEAGTYSLIIEHSSTSCADTATVEVFESKIFPTAIIDPPDTLSCATPMVNLNGNNSVGTAPLSYLWETEMGNITGLATIASTTVNLPELYSLIVTDMDNFCKDTAQIVVVENTLAPLADAGVEGQLNCSTSMDTLDGSNSSMGPLMTYLWQTDTGNIVSGTTTLMPIVDEDGVYDLIVTNVQNGCSDTSNIVVVESFETPTVQIATPDSLDCEQTTVVLDATASDSSGIFLIEWETISGHLLPNSVHTLRPIADEPGIYQLNITNITNNCSHSAVVEVHQQIAFPNAVAISDGILNCSNAPVTLDASNSSSNGGAPLVYEWRDENGGPLGNMESLEVTEAATYFLEITNSQNQCTDIDSIEVLIDTIAPIAEAGTGFELDCITTEARLNAGASSPGLDYLWTGTGIVEGENTLTPLINQAAWYYLSIINPNNACTAIDSVEVTQDTNLPMVEVREADTLNCLDTSIVLNATLMPNNPNFILEWISNDGGNIEEGGNTLNPLVNEAGTYILSVVDTSNNCRASDRVIVVENTTAPNADAGMDAELTCAVTNLSIGSTNSSMGNNFSYRWTSINGFLETNEINALQPQIDSMGTYILTVTNNQNNCQASDTVSITSNRDRPTIVVTPPANLSCSVHSISLDASASTGNGNLSFEWSTSNGNITSENNVALVQANEAGFYQVLAQDDDNGCEDSMSIEVVQDANVPIAHTEDSIAISCLSGRVNLEGMGSSQGPEFVYEWIALSPNGAIESGQDQLVAEASASGDYLLIVTDTIRNCADSSVVTVTEDCTPVVSVFSDADTINCYQTLTTLHGQFDQQGGNFSFYWYLIENAEIVDSSQLDLQINQGGTYVLMLTNNEFNTTGTDTIFVVDDRSLPVADAGPNLTLSCDTPCDVLDGTGSSQNGNFLYEWTTFDGNFVGDTSQLMVKVDRRGLYDLTVTNLDNGCAATSGVEVMLDESFVEVCFDDDFVIPCNQDTIVVSANCSTQSADMVYQWTTIGGNIIGATQAPAIRTDIPATYFLEVRDTSNGCTARDSISITALDCNLIVTTSPDDTLNCQIDSILATANVIPNTNELTFAWTDASGLLISDDLTAVLRQGGVYTFTATNTSTGVVASDEINIVEDYLLPLADAGNDANLDCDTDTIVLNGNASSGNRSIEWTSLGGQAIVNPNELQASVSDTGLYQLTVINLDNACTASDVVHIGADFNLPIADAGPDQQMACNASSVSLSGENSSLSDVIILWETIHSGDICAGANTANPIVCETGIYQIIVQSTINACEARDTVEVSPNDIAPPAFAGRDTALNCAITAINLQAEGPPLGAYSVEWTQLETGNIIATDNYQPEVTTAGLYQIRVIDNTTTCDSIDVVEVFIDTIAPVANAGLSDTITCTQTSLQLSGTVSPSASYDYLWTSENNNLIGNATTLSPTVSAADNYTLLVINPINQCRDSAQVMIFEDENLPEVVLSPDTTLTCATDEIVLMATVNELGLDLEWSNSAGLILGNNLNLNVIEPDTFFFTATNPNNNCSTTEAIIVTEDITFPTAVISANTTQITCTFTEILLDGNASAPANALLYEWTRNNSPTVLSNTADFTAELPGDYTLTVIDSTNGCAHDTSITITQDASIPNVEIAPPSELNCLLDSLTLDGSNSTNANVTYFWLNEASDTLSHELVVNIEQAGDYTLTIIDNNSGCDNSDIVTVIRNDDLPEVAASVVNNQALDCEQTSVQLTAEGSATGNHIDYIWTTPSGNITSDNQSFNAIADAAGLYVLQVTNNNNGCIASDSVIVVADAALITALDLNIVTPSCFGEDDASLIIENITGGNEPFVYQLGEDLFRTFPQFDYLEAGEYWLSIEDALGCQFDTLVSIRPPEKLTVDLGEDISIQLGDSIDIEAQINTNYSNIAWTPKEDIACQECLIQNLKPLKQSTYAITVSNENGCIAEDQITIFVAKDRRVYIPNIFTPDSNTPNDLFGIFGGNDVEAVLQFKIFDRWGNMVFAKENFQPNDPTMAWDGTFKGQQLNSAVFGYWAEVLFKDGIVEMIKGEVILMR